MPPMSSCPWEEVDDEEMKRSIKRSFILSFIGFLRRAAIAGGARIPLADFGIRFQNI